MERDERSGERGGAQAGRTLSAEVAALLTGGSHHPILDAGAIAVADPRLRLQLVDLGGVSATLLAAELERVVKLFERPPAERAHWARPVEHAAGAVGPSAAVAADLSKLFPAQRNALLDGAQNAPKDSEEVRDIFWTMLADHPESLAAAKRLLVRYGRPIYKSRIPLIQGELRRLANQHGRSPGAELEALALSRIFEAVQAARRYAPGELNRARKGPGDDRTVKLWRRGARCAIRARLNDLLTKDILGVGWRKRELSLEGSKRGRRARADQMVAGHDPCGPIEARLMIEQLIGRAGLSKRESDLIAALRSGCGTFAEAAERLHVAPSSARVLWLRARKKIKNAA